MKCSFKGSLSKSSFLVTHSASAESAIPTKGHWSYLSDMWAKGRDAPVARSRCAIPDPLKVSVVDEFSIEKGHKYAKLVIDSKEKEMLYLHRGKSKEDFRPFFKEHDSSWYKGIEGCMNKIKGDKAHCLRLQGLRLLLQQDMVCFPSQAQEDGSQNKGLGML